MSTSFIEASQAFSAKVMWVRPERESCSVLFFDI